MRWNAHNKITISCTICDLKVCDNGNRRAATQLVTKYVVPKLMSNYGVFNGSDGRFVFVSEITLWDSMESKESEWDSIESKDSEICSADENS